MVEYSLVMKFCSSFEDDEDNTPFLLAYVRSTLLYVCTHVPPLR